MPNSTRVAMKFMKGLVSAQLPCDGYARPVNFDPDARAAHVMSEHNCTTARCTHHIMGGVPDGWP